MAVYNQSFAAQIDGWVKQTDARITAVFRQSAHDVINKAQENAPHDTGFLKASLVVALNSPVPPAIRVKPEGEGQAYQAPNISAVIATAKMGDTISAGWTAAHALPQEYGSRPHKIRPRKKGALHWRNAAGEGVFAMEVDHPGNPPTAFVRRAVAEWPQIVNAVVARAKSLAGR